MDGWKDVQTMLLFISMMGYVCMGMSASVVLDKRAQVQVLWHGCNIALN